MQQTLNPLQSGVRTLLVFLNIFLGITCLQAQFVTNGSASSQGGGCYQLTPDQPTQAGSIFSAAPVNLNQPLTISARFNFGCKDANGADGIVFVFATSSGSLGGGGGGLGYDGISPSFAIEYDDYQNSNFGDPASDHVAIITNGSVDHNSGNTLVGPIPMPNLEDCGDHCFLLNWNPATMTLTASLDGISITYVGSISAFLGGATNAYYGFTSATGSLSNIHTVCVGASQLQPMEDIDICPGESAQLQADPNGMGYQWAPNPTLSALNIGNPVATPLQTTTYAVTISYECGATASDDVTVNVFPSPTATASSNSPVCSGETIQLMASGGVSYSWSGPFFSSGLQNPVIPNAGFDNAGIYSVTVTDANGCTDEAFTNVAVLPPTPVAIVPPPLPFCQNAPVQTLSAVPPGGTWGGAANSLGQIDPAALGPGLHSVTYTATGANGCVGMDEIQIQVVALPNVTIIPAGPFCPTDPVQTLNATPSGGIWGGAANSLGQINPAALGVGSHQVTYTYIDSYLCSATASMSVQILPGTNVVIQPAGPFCQGAGIQTLSATPSGGSWGGAANASGQINPAVLGPGMHTVTYTYNVQGACAGFASAVIQVYCQPFATISGAATLCEGETGQLQVICGGVDGSGGACFNGPYVLNYSINGIPQAPITITSSPFLIPASIPGTYTIPNVTDGNGCSAAGTGTGTIQVVGAPAVSNFNITCDSTNTMYTVGFQISGGTPVTYSVSGPVPGTLTPNPPYIFTSQAIPSGSPYSFLVNDGNDCDPTTLAGNFSCQCVTNAGTMNLTPLSACVGQTVTVTHNGDEVLDGNDNLDFVLHSSNGNSLGTVFATGNSLQFSLVPPMVPGVTYYISAVAGDDNGSGGVDLNDPCLSVSFGTPVVFNALPTGSIGSNVEICKGESATLTFSLSGNAPFDVVYSNGTQNLTLNNIFNNHTLNVSPAATTTYSLVSVSDNSNPACPTTNGNSVTVTVWEADTTAQAFEICQGDSLFLAGVFRKTAGTYQEVLSTVHGCDSLVVSALAVNALDTTYLFDSSCNPANVGVTSQVFSNNNGCDSLVVRTVTFSTSDTTLLSSATCDPALAGVFSQNYVTPEGCDSIVIETVSLVFSDTTYLFSGTCDPSGVGVFTNILSNQGGCDSTVILTVSPLPSDTTYLSDTSCDPASTGVFTQTLTNQDGCDSLVVTTVTYSQSDTTLLSSSTCDPSQTGVFTQNYFTTDGCDSLVITTVSLLPSDITSLSATTCDPAQTGSFTQNLSNQFGCDSVVTTTVTLLPSDTVFLFETSCNPLDTGQTVVVLANQFGCDSTVVTLTSLLPPDNCGIQASLTGSTIPCGSTLGTLTLTATLGLPPFNYAWSGASSGTGSLAAANTPQTISSLPPGTYSVTITSANGLSTTLGAQIFQLTSPVVSLSAASDYNGFAISCFGESDGSAQATSNGGQAPYQFLWSNGASSQISSGLTAGNYQVTVTDANNCTATGSISLNEPPPFEIAFTVNDLDCFGQNAGAIFVDREGGVGPYQFSLAGGAFQSSNAFTGLPAGVFEVSALDANGCEASEIIGIQAPVPLDVELGDDHFIKFGETATLTAIVNLPYDSLAKISWTGLDSVECPNCLTQPVAPLFTTTYSVNITAENGCTDKDAVTVFVDRRKQIYVPNAFSPNGDGLNDVFMIFAKPNVVVNIRSFLVFSRWGETVFEYYNFQPNDPAYGWDGNHRGERMNPALFVWFAEVEFVDGVVVVYEGGVTLMD